MIRLVIGYDGSLAAREAIRAAGTLFPAAQAHVVHVWLRAAFETEPPPFGDVRGLGTDAVDAMAAQGEALARAAGLAAMGRTVRATGPVSRALLAEIEELQPHVVVLGTRGGRGSGASVSLGLLAHSPAPLLVVARRGRHPTASAP